LSVSSILPIKEYFFHSAILGIAKVLPYLFDKLLILPLFGLTVLGYYQFGVQVLTVVSMLPVIIYGYLLPRESKNSSNDSIRVYTKLGIITSGILSASLIFFLPSIVVNLFPSFISAIFPAQVILMAGVPLTISSVYNSVYMARKKSWHVVIGSLIFIGSQSLFIVLLGNLLGIVGLSISTVIASTIQCAYLIIKAKGIGMETSGNS
jgi:O-antigen/teichoic acid export membrane protein